MIARRTLVAGLAGLLAGAWMPGFLKPISAAEYSLKVAPDHSRRVVREGCREVMRCGRDGCVARLVCHAPCPDGFSCYPLYGAYGPYGGYNYWSAYTSGAY